MPRSLEPSIIVLETTLARGSLIALPNPKATDDSGKPAPATYETLRFQYNPETVTRSRTGQWERKLDKKTTSAAQLKEEQAAARGGALKAKAEIISFKLVFDATELILRGEDTGSVSGGQFGGTAQSRGILPELALLERFALGPDQVPEPQEKKNEFDLISLTPTEALLLLGPRTFPGVITQLNIVEQRFNPELVPVRAEIDVRFRVLETTAVAANKDTAQAFKDLLEQRRTLAQDPANGFTSSNLGNVIAAAIVGRTPKGTT